MSPRRVVGCLAREKLCPDKGVDLVFIVATRGPRRLATQQRWRRRPASAMPVLRRRRP